MSPQPGLTLDAGALIAAERGDPALARILVRAYERDAVLAVPAGALAQVWRGGSRQARLAKLLGSGLCEIVPVDEHLAKKCGVLCGATDTSDVVDASVVVVAHDRGHRVVTSDPEDLRRLDPTLELIVV